MTTYTDPQIAATIGGQWATLTPAQQSFYVANFRAQVNTDRFYGANPSLLTAPVQSQLTGPQRGALAQVAAAGSQSASLSSVGGSVVQAATSPLGLLAIGALLFLVLRRR